MGMTYFDNDLKKYSGKSERIQSILNTLSENEPIHHNALKKIIVDSESMAKKTFDKLIHELVDLGIVNVRKEGNKKIYSVKKNFEVDEQDLERNIKIDLHLAKINIEYLKINYSRFDVLNKSAHSYFVLKDIFYSLQIIDFLISLNYPNKEDYLKKESLLRNYINQIFKMIKKDKDATKIYPIIINNLFPKRRQDILNPNIKSTS